MKIGYICDYSLSENLGGAEITNLIMIESGKDYGYDVVQITRNDFDPLQLNFDLLIVDNVATFSLEQVEYILRKPFIYFCQDTNLAPATNRMISNAIYSVFLSPLQLGFYRKRLEFKDAYLIPSPVKADSFHSGDKKDLAIYVGLIAEHKGIENVISFARANPNMAVYLCGPLDYNLPNLANLVYKGILSEAELVNLYATAKYLIHLPETIEAFGRTILEAYFSDCILIVNKNIGCLSYDWDWSDKRLIARKVTNAPKEFWRLVEEHVRFLGKE